MTHGLRVLTAARHLPCLMVGGALALASCSDGVVPSSSALGEEAFDRLVDPLLRPRSTIDPDGTHERVVETYRDGAGVATEFVVDEVIVGPVSSADLEAFLARSRGTIVGDDSVPPPPEGFDIRWDPEDPRVRATRYTVRVDLSTVAAESVLDAEGLIPGLEDYAFSSADAARLIALTVHAQADEFDVTPNYVFEDDGLLHSTSEAGGINMFDQSDFNSTANGSSVAAAWQLLIAYDTTPVPVRLAVIDRGFWLDGAGVPMPGTDIGASAPLQYDFKDDDYAAGGMGDGNSPWHGTGVSSVAGGLLDNGLGAAGTGGLVAQLMLFKRDATMASKERALRTAVQWGAEVINMSFSGSCNGNCSANSGAIIERVNEANAAKVIIVASAGNDGIDVDAQGRYPCTLNYVICVGALQNVSTDAWQSSNYGTSVDIFAPTTILTMPNPNTSPGLFTFGGTSASAPFVAGVAAMMRAVDPGLDSDTVRNIMRQTGGTSSDPKVYRTLDALAALAYVMAYSVPDDVFEGVVPTLTSPPGWNPTLTMDPVSIDPVGGPDTFRIEVPDYSYGYFGIENMRAGLGAIGAQLVREDGNACLAPEGFETISPVNDPTHSNFAADLLAPGSYLLKLSTSVYPQRYNVLTQLSASPLTDDAFEPNDIFGTRAIIGDISTGANIDTNGDDDWYGFQSSSSPLLYGAYHNFEISCADQPVTVSFYEVSGGVPSLLTTLSGTNLTYSLPMGLGAPKDFAVRIWGYRGRYRFSRDEGVDDGWLDQFLEFHRFLPPHILVSDVLVDDHVYYATYARDAVELGISLLGEGIEMKVYDQELRLVATGVPNPRTGAIEARPTGAYEEGAGLFVQLTRMIGYERGDLPFELSVGN